MNIKKLRTTADGCFGLSNRGILNVTNNNIKCLVWDQPLKHTSVENPTNCSNVESRLKRIGNLFQACLHPLSEIISDKEWKTLRAREAVKKRRKKVSNRTVNYFRQRNKCSQYLVSRKRNVKIRKKKKRKRVLRKYYAVLVKIIKIGKHGDNYNVIFKNSGTKAETTE